MAQNNKKNNNNEKICINRQIWESIPPEVKSLHSSLFKPFYIRTRYGETVEGILIGARWDIAQVQIMSIEKVYDPGVGGYKERWILKTIDGKMVIAYGEIKREEYIEPHQTEQ